MKGEYAEEKDHNNNMFAKLHPIQKFQQQQQQPLHPTHHFQVGRECQTSEEADSGGATPSSAATTNKKEPNSGDGASIEVARRPRGRPPGSKNKPKPPVIITRDTEPSMSPYILELAGGVDIVDSMYRFCRKRNMGLCILTGSGSVANVTLRQPSTTPGATVTFHGRFDILSLSATILPATASTVVPSGFVISLAGPQGQIVGGSVVGSLMAAGTVYVVAASFNSPSYHRLPADDGVGTSGSGGNERGQSPPAVSGGGDGGGHPPSAAADSCGMSIYSCHMPSNVIWAPTPSQPPPY